MCVSQRWVPLLRNHCFRIECYSRVQIKVMFEILLFFKYILCVVVVCNSDLFISVHRQPNQREKRSPSGGVSQWQKCSVFLRNTHQSTTSFLSVTKAFIDAGFRRLAGSNGKVMNWLTGSLIYLFMERSLYWIGQPNDWILISESISPCLLNYPNSFPPMQQVTRWDGVNRGSTHLYGKPSSYVQWHLKRQQLEYLFSLLYNS